MGLVGNEGTWHTEDAAGVVLVNAGDFLETTHKQDCGDKTKEQSSSGQAEQKATNRDKCSAWHLTEKAERETEKGSDLQLWFTETEKHHLIVISEQGPSGMLLLKLLVWF